MFWGGKVQKFTRAEIQFRLYMKDVIVRDGGEIGADGDVLPDEFVGVFYEALFPRGIRMGEEDFGVQHFCDIFVFGELGSVVCGDGTDVPFKGFEELYDKLCDSLCVLAPGRLCHEEFLCGALDQRDYGALAVLSDDGVHLPIAESGPLVHHGGSFVDADAVPDGDVRTHRPSSVLEVVWQAGV